MGLAVLLPNGTRSARCVGARTAARLRGPGDARATDDAPVEASGARTWPYLTSEAVFETVEGAPRLGKTGGQVGLGRSGSHWGATGRRATRCKSPSKKPAAFLGSVHTSCLR